MSGNPESAPTLIHLRPAQKKALSARALKHDTNVNEEVRRAVDSYLSGITAEEVALLNEASKKTAAMFKDMERALMQTNKKCDAVFAQMAQLRGGYPIGAQ